MRKRVDFTKATYDRIAAAYAKKYFGITVLEKQHTYFTRLCKKGASILDVACGPGRDVRYFMDKGYKVIGIDYSRGMIREARKRTPRGDFREMDMQRLDFDDETFDGLWVKSVIHHLPKKEAEKAVREFRRVLKPGGVLFISSYLGKGHRITTYDGNPREYFMYGKSELNDMLRRMSFRIIKSSTRKDYDGSGKDWIETFARKRAR